MVPLVEFVDTIGEWHVDTIGEQLVDDLVTSVKHVVLGDWFQGQNLVFKGGNVNPIFQNAYSNWLNQLVTNEEIWPKVILVFG